MPRKRRNKAINPIVRFFMDIVNDPRKAKYEGIFKAALIIGLGVIILLILWFSGILGKLTFIGACFKQSC